MTDKTATATGTAPARRKFLGAGVAGAAALTAPMVSVAQSPIVLKMQGSWGAKDIFNEMAEEYVKRVNEMAGGRLRIDYLVAGAVVKPFEVMDAVAKGVLDAGHTVPVYWYGKSKVASLFGSGPINGCDAHQTLAWIYRGGGLALYNELLGKLNLNVVGFFACRCRRSPRLVQEAHHGPSRAEGPEVPHRRPGRRPVPGDGREGHPAAGRRDHPGAGKGVIDAFEFNNPTSDMRFGAQDVIKNYMMGSYHQAMEFFEIASTRTSGTRSPRTCRRSCSTRRGGFVVKLVDGDGQLLARPA
jgi:TRAP-type mannitol/chloroaromatic compound transport system substrate-binding protein